MEKKNMKNKLKISTIMLLLGSAFWTQSATLITTGDTILGDFSTGNFTLDAASSPLPTQSASGISFSSATVDVGNNWYGAFAGNSATDWSSAFTQSTLNQSWSSSDLSLVMGNSAGTSSVPISVLVTLYDNTFAKIQDYTATIPTSVSASQYIKLIGNNVYTGSAQNVLGFQLDYNGLATIGLNFAYVIPEPSSISLMGLGLMGLAAMRIRRKS
jgi:hypothetical protein